MDHATTTVPVEKLKLSKAPAAEIAAAAMAAQRDAGLDQADFVIVAVPAGSSDEAHDVVDAALT